MYVIKDVEISSNVMTENGFSVIENMLGYNYRMVTDYIEFFYKPCCLG